MKNNYFGLLEIKKKGTRKNYNLKSNSKKLEPKNKLIKKNNYDEVRVKFLFIKYKKFNEIEAKNALIEMCYPIIFALLKKFGKKINTTKMLLTHDDLFNEGILIVDRCINSYKLKYKVKFSTFLWISLIRGFTRFIDTNLLKPGKMFVSFVEQNEEENNDAEVLENIYNKKKYTKDVRNYLKHEEIDLLEKDFFSFFTELETKIIYLKYKKYNADEITNILELSSAKYYKMIKNIKEKTRKKL